jgi:hypothetical protein
LAGRAAETALAVAHMPAATANASVLIDLVMMISSYCDVERRTAA